MTRSLLGLFVLVCGYAASAAVLIWAAFALHVVLGFVAFCLICAAVARALDRVFAEDRPEPVDEYAATEGYIRHG